MLEQRLRRLQERHVLTARDELPTEGGCAAEIEDQDECRVEEEVLRYPRCGEAAGRGDVVVAEEDQLRC